MAAFINIIRPVAFKQNLPLLAVFMALATVAGIFVFLQPPPEDRLRKAVTEHVGSLPGAKDFLLFGAVADVRFADGSVRHLEFAEDRGAWAVSKDLAEDFKKTLQDPAVVAQVMERLAKRMAARFSVDVRVKEGTAYKYFLARDADGLRGTVTVSFAYLNEQKRGRYVETWRYADGRWSNSGIGSLFDFSGAGGP